MKKIKNCFFLLAFLLTTIGYDTYAQGTVPSQPKLKITKNVKDNSAPKIVVQSTTNELNFIEKDSLKEQIGLSKVSNTSDQNKPVSTATQVALNLKINSSEKGTANGVATLQSNGKLTSAQLPAISATMIVNDSEFAQGDDIAETLDILTDGVDAVNSQLNLKQATLVSGNNIKTLENNSLLGSGNIDLTKNDVGLSNVENTSDINKPVSTATQSALDTKVNSSLVGANNGVATLGSDGKIPNSQIPAIAISENFPVASEAAMLALSQAETGDIAIRSDNSTSYILTSTPASTLGNWQVLLTPLSPVQSVNGQTGNITLTTTNVADTTNKRYQTDVQNSRNDATSSIQTQLNGKQPLLTNPITGTGTNTRIPVFTGGTTIGNSKLYTNGSGFVGYSDNGGTEPMYAGFNAFHTGSIAAYFESLSNSNSNGVILGTSDGNVPFINGQKDDFSGGSNLSINGNGFETYIGSYTSNGSGAKLQVTGKATVSDELSSLGLKYTRGIELVSTDLNSLLVAGFYSGNYFINAPENNSGHFYITVERHGSSELWVHQVATSLGAGLTGNQIYSRTRENGTWQPWEKLATTNNTELTGTTQVDNLSAQGVVEAPSITQSGFETPKIIVKDVVPSATVTGTTTETILKSYTIPANAFAANDIMNMQSFRCEKPVTNGVGTTFKVYVNTSNTLSGATQIAILTIVNSNVVGKMIRSFALRGGNLIGMSATLSTVTDINQQPVAQSSTPFDPSVVNYIITTATLANVSDYVYQSEMLITN